MSTPNLIPHLKPSSGPAAWGEGVLPIRVGDVVDLYNKNGELFRVRVDDNSDDELLYGVVTAIQYEAILVDANGSRVGDDVVVPRKCVVTVTRY